jgi:hypothetical protein
MLIIMVFAGLISLWQRVTISKEDLQKEKEELLKMDVQSKQWSIFTTASNLIIEKQLAGSLPWDSGDYLYLRSNPAIPYFTDKLFGDWLHVSFNGVFLQRWNHTRDINCDLIYINFDTLKVTELETGIPSKDWTTEKISIDEINFIFSTSEADFSYNVKQTEINTPLK